jgi:hypothetical protein
MVELLVPDSPTPRTHHLSEIARKLGVLEHNAYLAIQRKWIHSNISACNFFVITALGEDGLWRAAEPLLSADAFAGYLSGGGWTGTRLDESTHNLDVLKEMFRRNEDFDVIGQRTEAVHGHILIPIGVAPSGNLVVAQGELNGIANQILEESDEYMYRDHGGMTIFVRQ